MGCVEEYQSPIAGAYNRPSRGCVIVIHPASSSGLLLYFASLLASNYLPNELTFLLVQVQPDLLQNEMRVFFCKYNDPPYVKVEKLDIMVRRPTSSYYKPLSTKMIS